MSYRLSVMFQVSRVADYAMFTPWHARLQRTGSFGRPVKAFGLGWHLLVD